MYGLPAEHFVGFVYVAPDLLDVAFAAGCYLVVELHTGALLECLDELHHRYAVAGADVEYLDVLCALAVKDALHGGNVGLGQVHDINIIPDACAVGRVVVIAEDAELRANADSRLCEVGYEVGRYAVGHFADDSRRMSADRIKVSQQNSLDGSAALNVVLDNLLVYLLGIAIGALGFLDGGLFGHGQVLLVRLTVDSA